MRNGPGRWLRWFLKGLGFAVALAFGVVALGLLYFATPFGGRHVARLATAKVNQTIAGHLSVGSVTLQGARLVLKDAELLDPQGTRVASVERVEITFSMADLLRKKLDLSCVKLIRPQVFLVADVHGLNLSRALAPRRPTPTAPQKKTSQTSSASFAVESLSIERARVEYRQLTAKPERTFAVDELGVSGSAAIERGGQGLAAELSLEGSLRAPVRGPLRLEVRATGSGEHREASLEATLAGLALDAKASMEDSEHLRATVSRLELPPSWLEALAPQARLKTGLTAHLEAAREGRRATATVDVSAAKARLHIRALADVPAQRLDALHLTLRDVNLADLILDGPASDIRADLEASASGRSVGTLSGHLALEVPASSLEGQPFGPVLVRARARDGVFTLDELNASLPGLKVQASGSGTSQSVAATADLEARDLAVLAQTVRRMTGKDLPLSGNGTLHLAARGPLRHPAVDVQAQVPFARFQKNQVEGLSLSARVPDLREPASASAHLTARKMNAGGHALSQVRLTAEHAGRALLLQLSSRGDIVVDLSAKGQLDRDNRGIALSRLALTYPEAAWHLESGPAHLAFRPSRLAVENLHLRAGAQALGVDASLEGKRLSARVELDAVDLSRLPHAVVSPSLKLAGIVSAHVKARGTVRHPEADVRLHVSGGQFRNYAGLDLDLDAAYHADRARGTLRASGDAVQLDSDFDLPVLALRSGGAVPLHLGARVRAFRLQDFVAAAHLDKPLEGLVSADVDVNGTTAEPKVRARISAKAFRYLETLPVDLAVKVDGDATAPLSARVDARIEGRDDFVELKTAFTPGRLLRRPPRKEELFAAPIRLRLALHALPLPLLYTSGLTDREVLGTASADAAFEGPPLAPRGHLSLTLAGVATGRMAPTDARFELDGTPSELRVVASATQGPVRLGELDATVHALIAQLATPHARASASFVVRARVGPLAVSTLQTLAAPDRDAAEQAPPMGGKLSVQLDAKGTLSDPRVTLAVRVDQLQSEHGPKGDIALDYQYGAAAHHLSLRVTGADASTLRADAQTTFDLSYPQISHPADIHQAPLDAVLTSSGLDPSFLSGLVPQVERIGGKLVAQAHLTGSVGHPKVNGAVEWKDGSIALEGNGRYQGIHLALNGDAQHLYLTDLSARSEAGTLHVTAQADEQSAGRYAIRSEVALQKLPIISGGQLLATVTLKSIIAGTATEQRIWLPDVNISEMRVELPDVKRKDLETLSEPTDIVLVRNGKPIKRQKQGTGGSGDAATSPDSPARIRATIHAPRNLWIRGKDVNIEVGLSDDFRVELAQSPSLFGKINVLRGRADVFGRKFDLQPESTVEFGGPVLEPSVNVVAEYKNEQEQITVDVNVTGQGTDLQIDPTSQPPLPQTEIYTLLATGHRTLRHGSGTTSPSGEAASVLGGLVAGQLKKTLSDKLPLDVLSIEAGDQGLEGSKVEAGTYVNDRLYLGFTGRIGADPLKLENSNAAHLEYQLSKRWSVQGEYGDANVGKAELMWSKDY